jgi:hypothetical protein
MIGSWAELWMLYIPKKRKKEGKKTNKQRKKERKKGKIYVSLPLYGITPLICRTTRRLTSTKGFAQIARALPCGA